MELLDAWDERYAHDNHRCVEAPDRSTLYRWIKGSWPGSANQLIRISSLLDIDPIGLIEISENSAAEIMSSLYESYQNKHWEPQALSVLNDFIGHKDKWPPQNLSEQFYDRNWNLDEFEHDLTLGINFYPVFEIEGASSNHNSGPQVFHFAYRHTALFGKQWAQYGYVTRYGEDCQLVSINGYVDSCVIQSPDAPSYIETWFGPSPTIIRIASLHEFTAKIVANPNAIDTRLRFPA